MEVHINKRDIDKGIRRLYKQASGQNRGNASASPTETTVISSFNHSLLTRLRDIGSGLKGVENNITRMQIRLSALSEIEERYRTMDSDNLDKFIEEVRKIITKHRFQGNPVLEDFVTSLDTREGSLDDVATVIESIRQEVAKSIERNKEEMTKANVSLENIFAVSSQSEKVRSVVEALKSDSAQLQKIGNWLDPTVVKRLI